MLSLVNRLRQEKDFARVHHTGRFFGQQFLAVKVVANNLDASRFGFLVGIKVSKKAVVRNKVKRRLREIVRLKLDKIKPGYDIVVMVKPEIAEKDYQEIDVAISGALEKAGLL